MIQTTVIIAAWNAERSVARSVRSAAAQGDVEVVVADDASTDGTVAAAAATGLARVLRAPANGGPAAARNRALDAATGDWVAVLDSDDTMAPGRVPRMIALAAEWGADVVLGNVRRTDEAGRWLDPQPFLSGKAHAAARAYGLADYVAGNLVVPGSRPLGYLKPLLRRAFLDRHGIRYDETLRNGEDTHLILAVLAAGGRVVFAPEADYHYVSRRGSISHRVDPAHLVALVAADDRFVDRHGGTMSSDVRALFARRRHALNRLRISEEILQSLKARRTGTALAGLWRHPTIATRVIRQLAAAARNRLAAPQLRADPRSPD